MSQRVEFIKLPVEILRFIARMLLQDDLPLVGARGLLLQDSYLEALRTWRSPHTHDIPCTPLSCCDSPSGARSGQASTCFFCDFGSSRSSFDLLAVCRHLREVVLEDALFWGEALLLHPPQLPEAFDRARTIAEPRLSFVGQGGSCLHVLAFLLQGLRVTKRVELALPSTDMQSKHSPSKWIREALSEGAPILEVVELRFDCAHAYEDATQKPIILLPAIRSSRLLNATFAIAGDCLTKLFMAAEQESFRWIRADIFKLLRLCARLQVLSFQMVLIPYDTLTPRRRATYPAAGFVVLNDLRYFHISDKRLEWVIARSNIHTHPECRMHPDILVSMRGDPSRLAESCNDCAQGPNIVAIGQHHPFMALRMKIHTREPWASCVPEYLSLSFGDDVESALSFRDPISMSSAGSFTVRNDVLSLQPIEFNTFVLPDDCLTLSTAMRGFLQGCRPLAIDEIHTFIIDMTGGSNSLHCWPESLGWQDILGHLVNVRTIIIYGISSFFSTHLMDFVAALDNEVLCEEHYPPGLPCKHLRTVRVPDARDAIPQDAIALLTSSMGYRQARGRPEIPLIRWTT